MVYNKIKNMTKYKISLIKKPNNDLNNTVYESKILFIVLLFILAQHVAKETLPHKTPINQPFIFKMEKKN